MGIEQMINADRELVIEWAGRLNTADDHRIQVNKRASEIYLSPDRSYPELVSYPNPFYSGEDWQPSEVNGATVNVIPLKGSTLLEVGEINGDWEQLQPVWERLIKGLQKFAHSGQRTPMEHLCTADRGTVIKWIQRIGDTAADVRIHIGSENVLLRDPAAAPILDLDMGRQGWAATVYLLSVPTGTLLQLEAVEGDRALVDAVWSRLINELQRLESYGRQDAPEPEPKESEKRGPKVGTDDRVREMHRLLNTGLFSRRKAAEQAGTDPRTYDNHCKRVTGEDPIGPWGVME